MSDPAQSPAPAAPVQGQSVLVTGGTGTFGQAFVRHCLVHGVRRLVVFSRDELKQSEMRRALPDPRLRFFVGDVRDAGRLARACRGVSIVVHAAALKQVQSCEENPEEALHTNVLGTLYVAQACIDAGVPRALFLSTDKAPNAATLYGATKFCAERVWVQSNVYAAGTPTKLSATRYGNVIGSRGSVLAVFRAQREANDPLTITAENATRFWMTIGQAVDLVCMALREMRGGEVFVPKCGSASVLDFARAVVEANGTYAPGHRVTGLTAGEKLHETLIGADEARDAFDFGDHFRIQPAVRSWGGSFPDTFNKVPADFQYRSDTNPHQLSVQQIRELQATC